MNILTATEVKERMQMYPNTKLVMVLGTTAFNAAHIPGSIDINEIQGITDQFDFATEIIVYCSDFSCPASISFYNLLVQAGYQNIYRLAGGLQEWETAGFELVRQDKSIA